MDQAERAARRADQERSIQRRRRAAYRRQRAAPRVGRRRASVLKSMRPFSRFSRVFTLVLAFGSVVAIAPIAPSVARAEDEDPNVTEAGDSTARAALVKSTLT